MHNNVLIASLDRLAQRLGASTHREVWVSTKTVQGYIDLIIRKGDLCVACEAENSPRRVRNDIRKAAALGAHYLLIVVPTGLVGRAVRRCLRRIGDCGLRRQVGVEVVLLAQANQRLQELLSFDDKGECQADIKTSMPGVKQKAETGPES